MNLRFLVQLFESAFVRKLGYMAAAALIMFVFGSHRAHALQWQWTGPPSPPNPTGTATDVCGQFSSSGPYGTGTYTETLTAGPGVPEIPVHLGDAGTCHVHDEFSTGGSGDYDLGRLIGVDGTAPGGNCTANAQKHYMIASPSGAPAATGSTACSSDGCTYTMDDPNGTFCGGVLCAGPFEIVEGKSGQGVAMQSAMNTGAHCTVGGSGGLAAVVAGPEATPLATMCQTSNGITYCDTKDASGKNCGTVNGDKLCISTLPPAGGCVQFNSGGVACTMPAGSSTAVTPPAPDNGTAGVPAVPDATVTEGTGTTGGTPGKAAYYSAATVAASSKPVTSGGAGQTGTLNGGVGGGSAVGGGGTGDCPAGGTCTGTPDSISGGLNCDSPPVCLDIDPVLCGLVNQQWLTRCTNVSETQIASGIGSLPAGIPNSSSDISDVVHEDTVTMQSGECPGPVTFQMYGKTVTYNIWGQLCAFAGYISAIVLLVAYMLATRIMAIGVISNGVT